MLLLSIQISNGAINKLIEAIRQIYDVNNATVAAIKDVAIASITPWYIWVPTILLSIIALLTLILSIKLSIEQTYIRLKDRVLEQMTTILESNNELIYISQLKVGYNNDDIIEALQKVIFNILNRPLLTSCFPIVYMCYDLWSDILIRHLGGENLSDYLLFDPNYQTSDKFYDSLSFFPHALRSDFEELAKLTPQRFYKRTKFENAAQASLKKGGILIKGFDYKAIYILYNAMKNLVELKRYKYKPESK